MHAKISCPDCGPAGVTHWVERWTLILEWLFTPVGFVFDFLIALMKPVAGLFPRERALASATALLTKAGFGTMQTAFDEKDNLRTRALWESAAAHGITMKEFRFFGKPEMNIFIAFFQNEFRVFQGLPRPRNSPSASLAWMDNKGIMNKKFRKAGIPVPEGETCVTLAHAERVFASLNGPAVVKPNEGSRSRHTFTHIMSIEELRDRFRRTKKISPWVLVEQELEGSVFRGTIISGKVVGVARRDPAVVVGDGIATIRELVEKENKNSLRRGPVFHPIPTAETEKELSRRGLAWESVPLHGELVVLNPKTSRSVGGTVTDVTDETHPDTIALLEYASRVLNSPLVGIDFVIRDIRRPWKEQKNCGIIECNSLPFLDLHHYPFSGRPRDAAGSLWEMVFPGTRISSSRA